MSTVVDFHTHILPGVDDGSHSPEESVAMLQMEAAQGVGCVIATPHFYPRHDRLDRFLERRLQAEQIMRKELKSHPELPQIHVGAEVHFFRGICDCDEISQLTVDGGKYILIEMPHPPWSEELYRELERICSDRKLIPIIAHIDRYISRFHTFNIPKRLAELPVLVQANGEFFLNKRTASMAMHMLKNGNIQLLGSDCHNTDSRKPNLAEAVALIEKRLGETATARINSYEQAVLCNKTVISTPLV